VFRKASTSFCAIAVSTAALACAAAADAHVMAAAAAAPTNCAGASDSTFSPLQVTTGEFDTTMEGGYVLLPFTVPAGTTAVRVRYCYDQPEAPTNARIKHVLDLGLYDARPVSGAVWGVDEFRGWGGSSHPDVTVSPNGFSSTAAYVANPRLHVQGRTTRGFEPGPIPSGEWAVELGVAAVASQTEGDGDGKVAWRVEIESSDDPLWQNDPYEPAAYDTTPAGSGSGWYAGDFHVHAEHSSLGDATMRESFDYAFTPIAQGGAGLDFLTLSDYVSDSAWGEIGRYQQDYPGKLIARSAEVITYRGHTNNHASATYVDYRTGPVYERRGDGSLELERAARPASAIFDAVHAAGGFTQINHPTIFPSAVPGFDFICRGCPWDYDAAETDYSKVDAIEVATGPPGLQQDPEPGPNPFTPPAIKFWEDAIDAGGVNRNKIAAVGSSDSHNAGRTPDPITQAPIGTATTVVHADELSERGIERAVKAGHTYVKIFGNDGPDLRFEASPTGSGEPPAIMGDTIRADDVSFTARVLGAGPSAARPGDYELFVLKDGAPLLGAPVTGDDFTFPFPGAGPGRYRLQLQRDTAIEAVSSPIYVEPASYARPKGATPLLVSLVPAYRACGSPDEVHGPPLAAGSCRSPAQESTVLTVGTLDANGVPAQSAGQVRLDVRPGDPATSADEADVVLSTRVTDVRCASPSPACPAGAGTDFSGRLLIDTMLRVTDRDNGSLPQTSGSAATAADIPLEVPVECTETTVGAIGGRCALDTTLDAVIPGAVKEGARAIWQLGQVELDDPGPNGTGYGAGCPQTCGDGDEAVFLRQGLFTP
jgi:hypothetical protein